MKKIFAILLSVFMLATTCSALDLWFTWKANPTNEMVTSYVIEKATLPNTNFVAVVTVAGTTNVGVVRGLTAGSYKFRVFAKNGSGNGPASNELSYPTNAPTKVLEFDYTVPR